MNERVQHWWKDTERGKPTTRRTSSLNTNWSTTNSTSTMLELHADFHSKNTADNPLSHHTTNVRFLTKILEIKTLGTTVTLAVCCHKTVPTHDGLKRNMLTTAEGE
jgi:hypothetical protein